ncbi:MAG: hypothetical protein ACI3V5_08255 [Faecousia sp.]
MSVKEQIHNYIRNANMKRDPDTAIGVSEIAEFCKEIRSGNIFDSVLLVFSYGVAKGYRMAKKESSL